MPVRRSSNNQGAPVVPYPPNRKFSIASPHHQRRLSLLADAAGPWAPALQTLFLGVSANKAEDGNSAEVAIAVRDSTYLLDFSVDHFTIDEDSSDEEDTIADHIIAVIQKYEHEHFVKFIGAGMPAKLKHMCPSLCSRLWLETDIIPVVIQANGQKAPKPSFWETKDVDEQADSMARKCLTKFGPSLVPLLQVGWRGVVQVDSDFKIHINTLRDHHKTCGEQTWKAVLHYAKILKEKKIKIAFFSATPQGGGVALMRHALVRFSKLLDVDLQWYVPKPRPGVFRSTKNMHNILQGVAEPNQRLSTEEKENILEWIRSNATRYWLSEGGPLRPPSEGGADIIVIDDPQMPGLIPMIKEMTPDRPVLYRSHIQIRSDLVATPGSPQAEAWDFLWKNIQHSDMFISHPIPQFVPRNVPQDKVCYLPATTDWLDGLNKPLNRWDSGYYGNKYNIQCASQHMTQLNYPARRYIVQVARFDPAKGIPTVIDGYAEFRRLAEEADITDIPQLVVAGNTSIDDPDGTIVYEQTLEQIETDYPHLAGDISVMRLDANDQLLNTLISRAHVVLQLSTREGFEVKVSEALHAGRPVIATLAGGIPLQVKDKENGYLVEPGDYKAVANHLIELFSDEDLWQRMHLAAKNGVSDEVGTPGNALSWYYLAAKWAEVGVERNGKGGLKGEEKWVNDMARDEAGFPYLKGENRLPRHFTQRKNVPLRN